MMHEIGKNGILVILSQRLEWEKKKMEIFEAGCGNYNNAQSRRHLLEGIIKEITA